MSADQKRFRYELWHKDALIGWVENESLWEAWDQIHRIALNSNKDGCEIRAAEGTPLDPFENAVMTDNRGNTYANLGDGRFQTILENGAILTVGPEAFPTAEKS